MTTTASAPKIRKQVEQASSTRQRTMGIIFLVLGFAIWYLFSRGIEEGVKTKFGMTPGGQTLVLPDMVLPTVATLNFLAILCVILGLIQLFKPDGFGRYTNLVLATVAAAFIFAFLTWAAAGKSLNLAGLMSSTLLKAVPLTLGALSGVLCERAGVVNIAIEGMMLMAAMVGCLVGSVTDNLWVGLVAGVASGAILGLVHGVLSIKYKTNQIISGTVINIFSIGFTSYISAKFMQQYQFLNNPGIFPAYLDAISGPNCVELIGIEYAPRPIIVNGVHRPRMVEEVTNHHRAM